MDIPVYQKKQACPVCKNFYRTLVVYHDEDGNLYFVLWCRPCHTAETYKGV